MIADIAAGDRHSMATTREGELYTWGFGETRPTGHKTKEAEDIYNPKKLDLTRHVGNVVLSQLSGGGQHSLLLAKRYN